VNCVIVTDYKAVPSVYDWLPGEVPEINIVPVDIRQVGKTVNTKLVDPVYTPFALVIVPFIVIV